MDRQAGPGILPVANETASTCTRWTRTGRQLRYDLRIIQQPERARACGAGAKASADRRPVDPPPILQLQIFEILGNGSEHDVTFTMHAEYFLFATLERGRVTAQPRNSSSIQDIRNMDVLTGTSVAGMQPFDRPVPAIYFIFPDLSVRHEGKYRLLFSLFEKLGRTDDEDRTDISPGIVAATHRMEVRSALFDVFSAKRFPGLTESTNLSRTFAEQGSRIRIRRDVRMRRRDNKQGKDWDGYDDDDNPHMQRLSQTPDPYSHAAAAAAIQRQPLEPLQQRPRSSNSHSHMLQSSAARRTSMNDLSQQYHQTQLPQPGGFAFPNAYGGPTAQPYSQPSVLHPPPQMPSTGYQSSSTGMMPASTQQSGYFGYAAAPQGMSQMQYPSISTPYDNSYSTTRNSGADYIIPPDPRRTSEQSSIPGTQQQQHQQQQQQQQQLYAAPQMPTYTRHQVMPQEHHNSIDNSIRPALPVQPPTRVTTPNPPPLSTKTSFGTTLPPLSTSFSQKLEAASPSSTTQSTTYTASLPTPVESHKRSYASTFPTSWQNNSNKHGSRPNENAPSSMFLAADADGDDTADLGDESFLRLYRRAGGNTVQRTIP